MLTRLIHPSCVQLNEDTGSACPCAVSCARSIFIVLVICSLVWLPAVHHTVCAELLLQHGHIHMGDGTAGSCFPRVRSCSFHCVIIQSTRAAVWRKTSPSVLHTAVCLDSVALPSLSSLPSRCTVQPLALQSQRVGEAPAQIFTWERNMAWCNMKGKTNI